MGVIRFKVWNDLWQNKARTIQVVLIIGLGAAALGMIVGTRNLVIDAMASGWQSINPAMINLFAGPPVDEATIDNLAGLEGLTSVEGYAIVNVEWRPNEAEDWQPAALVARDDYVNQEYNRVSLVEGNWPEERTMAAENSTIDFYGVPVDGQILIKANGREHLVDINGSIDDPVSAPPNFGGNAQFYATLDYLAELTDQSGFNVILARAPEYDPEALTVVANEMQDKLEKQGVNSGGFLPPTFDQVADPEKHFFQDVMDGIFLVLGILAVLALFLSLFLVYNTINALVSQQVNQIGVMKAIGARTWQILATYFLLVMGYSLMALLISLPLGAIGGWILTVFLLSSFNADPGDFGISWPAFIAQVSVVVVAPLVAALVPIISGSRITVNQAINTYGLSAEPSRLDRALAQARRLPRIFLLTISNTFRKKGRVLLTQITLVLSGLIFMMVMTARDSAAHTFGDVLFSILRFDVTLSLQEPERISRLESLTAEHPGVEAVEMWGLNTGTIRLEGTEATDNDESASIFGVPLPTQLYGHQMRAGRWLVPEDEYAVVLNQKLANDAGVTIGDWVTLDHGVAGESNWQIVGLLFDPVITDSAHVSRETLLRELGSVGKASSLWIQTKNNDPATQLATAESLRDLYEIEQIKVDPAGIFNADTSSEITAQILDQFGIIITLLLIMAFLIALVGSIALSGTLSLNVMERRREIGVMRAIGAKSREIGRLFVGEGLILGLMSWAIAVPLSIPAGQLMTQALSEALGNEIVYKFSLTGPLMWLAVIVILAVVASWFPARSAIRLSVRESLAYQ
jgi:putative ABC transport system permease protein